uniref:Plexin-B1 n=1 Tax=Erpetoichthys calabaricus TaxID=27687 RepID=A0A8C4TAH4_ERPCA
MKATCCLPLVIFCWMLPLSLIQLAYPLTDGAFSWSSDTILNHLALDPETGQLYVGGVNNLFHLSQDLQLLSSGRTGPQLDNPDCLPPINKEDCHQARLTDNTNKLLLLAATERSLIVCGTISQGICEKRSLDNVSVVLYQTKNPVDTQYVAVNDPRVSTVGVVVGSFLFVGRGYTSKGPGGITPITTRHLEGDAIFSQEDLGKLVVGSYSEYNSNFVAALHYNSYVYFVFFRRDVKSKREFRTYVSRLCDSDHSYYSYVEVPLKCSIERDGNYLVYNLAQATFLAKDSGSGTSPTLYVVMAVGQSSSHIPTASTALCAYPMSDIDKAVEKARFLCYTAEGRNDAGFEEAYIEYDVASQCAKLRENSPFEYKCGDEHTPSPIASRMSVEAVPAVTMETQLSAVASVSEVNQTIIFLGDAKGQLHKVFLKSLNEGQVYSSEILDAESPVSSDLLLNVNQDQIYVMTSNKVINVPVSSCEQYANCTSCLESQDPFCGWCVLEGRCSRKSECKRFLDVNQWLWSYRNEEHCITVQNLNPSNQSRENPAQVSLFVDRLPSLSEGEHLTCSFGESVNQPAIVKGINVICQPPLPEHIPPNDQGKDFVSVQLALKFNNVIVTSVDFIFYDCKAVSELAISSPCRSCVGSVWGCHWCLKEHICTHLDSCPSEQIIYNEKSLNLDHKGVDCCPYVYAIQGSQLVSVGFGKQLVLLAKNLNLFKDENFICVVEIGMNVLHLRAELQTSSEDHNISYVTCEEKEFFYSAMVAEFSVPVHLRRVYSYQIDNFPELNMSLYDCAIGRSDCSHCKAADLQYGCVWCGGPHPICLYEGACKDEVVKVCPDPIIYNIEPLTGPIEGGIALTIYGSNLGQRFEEIEGTVTVADIPCEPDFQKYQISTRIVCELSKSDTELSGPVKVVVQGRQPGMSTQFFTYQNPELTSVFPTQGPVAGGTFLTIEGEKLHTGQHSDVSAFVGSVPCDLIGNIEDTKLICCTNPSNETAELPVKVIFGQAVRTLEKTFFKFRANPVIISAQPTKSFYGGGRIIKVEGHNLDVVQQPFFLVWAEQMNTERRRRQTFNVPGLGINNTALFKFQGLCSVLSSNYMECRTPYVEERLKVTDVEFVLDNLRLSFSSIGGEEFSYKPNPVLKHLNSENKHQPFHFKQGSIMGVEGDGLTLAMTKDEVVAKLGDGICTVKTLTKTDLYCEPPAVQPAPLHGDDLPEFMVEMGNLTFNLGKVVYDEDGLSHFPVEAQIGLGVGAGVVITIVLIIILMYRRKSKQAMRDYKKVLVQLENLEVNVGDQCRKEFTDLMTEMMDLTSDLEVNGIPFLDYRTYAERIFFPGHRECPLRKGLDVPELRKQTVEQGLTQLSNLLNSKLFLIKFIHTLEDQQGFSQRDRGYVASLLTIALHGKLEYFTDIMKTLLGDLVEQYVAKNPKLMLRRTETVVEKILSNWMSICLYSFLRESAGEPLYMLYRAIKYQVDKGPVDAVTGKAKRTLNDSHLLREDIEYQALTLTVITKNGMEVQPIPVRVLDTDTITQVKEKILDQICKGAPFSQRPSVSTLDLEWRAGMAGHLTLSDDDVTAVVQGRWKRLNTLQHYKVPDGATVALIPRLHNGLQHGVNQVFITGEKTPMLEDGEDGGVKLWHLVKSTEEPEIPKHRRSSLRERERAKAIPEIFLTRLLSMKGTLQKFVDDVFQSILSTNCPVPIAVRYFFDFLDEMAEKHGIDDEETVHIWKTNSLPLRFWVNILKNPQFIFDVQVSDNVDAILSVIAQTFIDSCTTSEHKVGRDSPVNKLLYAREIPRYKKLVEKYYRDIRSTSSGCYQEMNSGLAELSRNFGSEMNSLVALHELYKYINKYYDKIIMALEEDPVGQKMQLACRLQQLAALVENKVTDL